MARARAQKDILSRVTDLGSEALQRLSDIPGGNRLLEMANESKSRLDEMQKKLRGLDELEKRVARLEKQLAAQAKPKPPATKPPAAKKPAAAKPGASPRRSSGSKSS
jgi:uncharacterized membrane protein YccC